MSKCYSSADGSQKWNIVQKYDTNHDYTILKLVKKYFWLMQWLADHDVRVPYMEASDWRNACGYKVHPQLEIQLHCIIQQCISPDVLFQLLWPCQHMPMGQGQWCRPEGHCFGGKQELWMCLMWNARKVKCCFQAGSDLHLLQQNEGEDYSSSRVGPAFVKKDAKPPGLTWEYHEGCLVACKTGLGTPVEDGNFNG